MLQSFLQALSLNVLVKS